jgi:hypothetical protein
LASSVSTHYCPLYQFTLNKLPASVTPPPTLKMPRARHLGALAQTACKQQEMLLRCHGSFSGSSAVRFSVL